MLLPAILSGQPMLLAAILSVQPILLAAILSGISMIVAALLSGQALLLAAILPGPPTLPSAILDEPTPSAGTHLLLPHLHPPPTPLLPFSPLPAPHIFLTLSSNASSSAMTSLGRSAPKFSP